MIQTSHFGFPDFLNDCQKHIPNQKNIDRIEAMMAFHLRSRVLFSKSLEVAKAPAYESNLRQERGGFLSSEA